MNDGKLRFYDKGKETLTIDDSSWGKNQTPETQLHIKEMTHEEMLEEAARREKENQVLDIAKNLMEENKEAFQHLAAIERKEFAEKDFEDLTRDQKIQLALEEIDWIVIGGQDGEEFYGSIQFLRKVLRSLR
jgi:excinuclease UvrABC ATPase subunit